MLNGKLRNRLNNRNRDNKGGNILTDAPACLIDCIVMEI